MATRPKPKALIIEPGEKELLALKKALKSLSIELIVANTKESALPLVFEHDFALIFIDLQNKTVKPLELAKSIHHKEKTEPTPIIFLSTVDENLSHDENAFAPGSIDYLVKPINPVILRSKIQIFLRLFFSEKSSSKLLSILQSSQKKLEKNNQQLERIAHYDLLTKLPNRFQFEENIKRTLSAAKRFNRKFALMFIDLDDFKKINDTLGHLVGDQLLSAVSTNLKKCFRESDFISRFGKEGFLARLGGDEFAIVLTDLRHSNDAGIAAERVINKVSGRYHVAGKEIYVSMSIGIACFPESASEISMLYHNADNAMYHAKSRGKNNYQFYNDELNTLHQQRLAIEKAIGGAIDSKELSLVYQPIYRLADNKMLGTEALIRWNSKTLGSIKPDDFIPITEDSGLISTIGEWVLQKSFSQLAKWQKQGFSSLIMSINISEKQLLKDDFKDYIHLLLEKTKVDPRFIHLELTETAISKEEANYEEIFNELKGLGIKLSIDDFGTGSASLLRLKLLPFDTLKIDQSFIGKVNFDKTNAVLSRTMIQLAKSLGLSVIAEGIETESELDFLVNEGCDHGIGYYLSKPLEVDSINELLENLEKK